MTSGAGRGFPGRTRPSGSRQPGDGEPFPPNASSLIGVARLGHPEMLVEISAIAVLD
jgi:enamine deaminase RidA (YjgF/YER057c/UK114 family)